MWGWGGTTVPELGQPKRSPIQGVAIQCGVSKPESGEEGNPHKGSPADNRARWGGHPCRVGVMTAVLIQAWLHTRRLIKQYNGNNRNQVFHCKRKELKIPKTRRNSYAALGLQLLV